MLGLIWVVFLLFGQQFVVLWVGEENRMGYWVAVLLIFPMIFSLSQSVGSQILWAKDKHRVQAIIKICVAIANIGLLVWLIKWNPLIGASIGTAVAIVFGDVVVMGIVFSRYIEISMKRYYVQVLRGILPCLLFVFIIGSLVTIVDLQGWIGFLVNCIVVSASYLVVLWFYGANEREKEVVKVVVRKIDEKYFKQLS
jgi:O-antigen/teichoic acid export membrane protein